LDVMHQFTTIYKPSINGLVEWTIKTSSLIIAKVAKTKTDLCDWNLKMYYVVWVYNTTYKIVIGP
jgi:hypothetical protein